ncbi:hypothetical protein ACH4E5_01440 [Streptomyces afghaniensis]|uniref:hypothetical protein n=1 Tax=Streptomyces afghaniensis TaxID=66865 RepID=UPI00378CF056
MQAVPREFAGSDVVADVTGLRTVGQQVLDHPVKALLRLADLGGRGAGTPPRRRRGAAVTRGR